MLYKWANAVYIIYSYILYSLIIKKLSQYLNISKYETWLDSYIVQNSSFISIAKIITNNQQCNPLACFSIYEKNDEEKTTNQYIILIC